MFEGLRGCVEQCIHNYYQKLPESDLKFHSLRILLFHWLKVADDDSEKLPLQERKYK